MPKWGSVCLLGLLCLAVPAAPATVAEERAALEALTVLVLAPAEGRAVVRKPDGELQSLGVGDLLPGTPERVTAILPDRLVAQAAPSRGGIPARRFWVYRQHGDGKTRVQVLDREPQPHPPIYRPQETPPPPGARSAQGAEVKHGR
jgi:hypothetical protein